MSPLDLALVIATEAHAGTTDKAGAAYILHPLRVMLQLDTEEERVVALLHDVVEDTEWTLDLLRAAGFSETIVQAVDHVTRRADETYEAFVARASENPIASRVKEADLIDNMDLGRIAEPTDRDRSRIEKYERALGVLRASRRGATH